MSNTDNMLEEALSILDADLNKIKVLSKAESTLDRAEATKLTDYIKVLIAVQKEDREQRRADNLKVKSDTEIEELAQQALKYLQLEEKKETTHDAEFVGPPLPPDDPK